MLPWIWLCRAFSRARPSGFEPETFGSVGGRPSNREPRSPRGIACTPPFSGVTRGDTRGHEGTRFVPTWFPPLFPPRGTRATHRPRPRRSRRRPDARRSRCLSNSNADVCASSRVSLKGVSETPLRVPGSARQSNPARRARDVRLARDGGDGRFRSPPLERIQGARRGFMRQPPS